MKKLLALILAVVMAFLSLASNAAIPEIMKKPMYNYSSDMTVSLDFNTAEQLAALLEESGLEFPDTFDAKMLFESLCSFSGEAAVKADISEDYNKIKLSMEADYDYDVDVNQNLSVAADVKMGLWLDLDISDVANPKCLVVISSPAATKYTYIDLFASLDDESKLMIVAMLKMLVNKEFVEQMNAAVVGFYEENAEITYNGKDCTIKLDNKDFLGLMDIATDVMSARLRALLPTTGEYPEGHEIIKYADSGLQLLGDGGYVLEYYHDGTVKEYCDISISVNNLLEMAGGETLAPENDLVLGFTITGEGKIFDVGTTTVVMPVLTEENSIDIMKSMMQPEEDVYYEEDNYVEYEPEYPSFYVDVYTEYMPDVEGKVYVPFRQTLEEAYSSNVDIAYDKGTITVTSEYFDDMQVLCFNIGSTKANVDGIDFEVGEIVLENGVTYVSADFFEIIFGWELDWASYDYLWHMYNVGFYTETFEDEYYDEW